MAVKDVREYLYTMLNQYLEMKEDLKDFEQALKDGYITEDRMSEVRENVAKLKENYDRVQYICYLLEEPNRKQKKAGFHRENHAVDDYFAMKNADLQAVKDENKSITSVIHAQLKGLTGKED